MKDKKDKTGKRDKKSLKTSKKGLQTPTTPVPSTATELNEEDLKKVTGGAQVDYYMKVEATEYKTQ